MTFIECRLEETGSPRARQILDGWEHYLPLFLMITPVGYKLLPEQESG